MTAMSDNEPTHAVPAWLVPPLDGFQADDLDRLHSLPPHTELIDASLVLPGPRTAYLDAALSVLAGSLRHGIPTDLRVRQEMTVTLEPSQRPEPDLIVIHAAAQPNMSQTTYLPGDVVLAVEVVSTASRARDWKRKPALYAGAGIQHFWLVEQERGEPVLHTYELDELTKSYVPTGIHHGTAKVEVPYPVEIDFGEIDRL